MEDNINNGRERIWHKNFKRYVEEIVHNKNYEGLYYTRQSNGTVNWVVTGNSVAGEKRLKWWESKANELGVPIRAGYLGIVARMIHPTGIHVCQICGREMSILYLYPTKATLKKLNNIATRMQLDKFDYVDKDIFMILDVLLKKGAYNDIRELFNIPQNTRNNVDEFKEYVKQTYVDKMSKRFSPGVMSNAPDRFDGFHSYGLCCRSVSDKGRHPDNLQQYGEDRRAYEFWSDGDWKESSWIMKDINREGKSADHTGPISCGFVHGNLLPVTSRFNSAKNNRMSLGDVQRLLKIEKSSEQVVSWHSKYLWDKLKYRVKNDEDAKQLSKLMVENLLNVLQVLNLISKAGYKEYLLGKLNPKYAFFAFKKENAKEKRLKINRTEERRNAIRYIRISLESLDNYAQKENRKHKPLILDNAVISKKIVAFIEMLSKKGYHIFNNDQDFISMLERKILKETNRSKIINYFLEYKIMANDSKLEESLNGIISSVGDLLINK